MPLDRDVDLSRLAWPPTDATDFLEFEDAGEAWESFSGNRSFVDLRGCEVEDVLRVAATDAAWLANHAADWADDPDDEHFDSLDELGTGCSALDVGTASAVMALSAAGCVTATSCNGQPGHQYPRPTVAFWTQQASLEIVEAAAAESDCGLENGANGVVILYTPDIVRFPRFAMAVHRRLSVG